MNSPLAFLWKVQLLSNNVLQYLGDTKNKGSFGAIMWRIVYIKVYIVIYDLLTIKTFSESILRSAEETVCRHGGSRRVSFNHALSNHLFY